MALPTAVYGSQQVRALDAYAIRELAVPSYVLMKRAAEAALRTLRTRWPTALSIGVVCGGGNNPGDGFVFARFARAAGLGGRRVGGCGGAGGWMWGWVVGRCVLTVVWDVMEL